MKSKKFTVLLAVLALVAAQLACALGEPTLSNVRTAKDADGVQTTSTFGAFDTVYVVSDLSNGVAGNIITSKWFAENVDGVDPNFLIDEADINVTEESFNGTIYFYFEPPTDGWPTGTYRVEVYFNGALTGTVNFSVQ
ncbi:MAG: hypothetical protein DPW18_02750 [Chloroflexi bacterium]|nr:hypothetical protein [Chloroflexota bacterium]MDL1942942.1 hypothetical protein [Chloroflexi bacterium CFX2]